MSPPRYSLADNEFNPAVSLEVLEVYSLGIRSSYYQFLVHVTHLK